MAGLTFVIFAKIVEKFFLILGGKEKKFWNMIEGAITRCQKCVALLYPLKRASYGRLKISKADNGQVSVFI